MSNGVAFQVGAILVVSGPTVVLPLLAFIRPARAVRSALKWEGARRPGRRVARRRRLSPRELRLGTRRVPAELRRGRGGRRRGCGPSLGAAPRGSPQSAADGRPRHADGRRCSSRRRRSPARGLGLPAATLMGISLGNQRWVDASRRIDISLTREFQETLVQLLIGVLFVLIAASVSPSDVEAAGGDRTRSGDGPPPRPVVVVLATWRSSLTWRERGFLARMAPRESSRALRHLRSASSSRRMESPAPTLCCRSSSS